MKKKVQTSRMYLAGLVLLVSSTFAWAMPSQWLTNAEEMAADYDEIVYGDVNGDNEVGLSDVGMIIDFYIEKDTPTEAQLKAVDFVDGGNGKVDLSEVGYIIDLYIEKLSQDDIKKIANQK